MARSQRTTSSKTTLPERANLEHLRKTAKARLAELQRDRPSAQLADAQLDVARANGFPSWRALKAAFVHLAEENGLAVGDWLGQPEGGVPLALHVRLEGRRLRANLDVPALGYLADPVEALSVADRRMTFRVTVRGVNAIYEGAWNAEAAEWRGLFTHDGRAQRLALRRGVFSAPRVDGLDGLWDGKDEAGTWLTFRIATDERGTFAWLSSSLVPGRWFQAERVERVGSRVSLEMKTLRVEGVLEPDGDRLEGRLYRGGQDTPIAFARRGPGAPTPWPPAKTVA